ncbi:NAD(P)/FAD-dependent oxidoreductase [Candidatus Uhrbacteria bacterium]|nr:NAD(P)/FAD-dependent oxidoreductase [Candidatus Uhrbacteria bacterium]
MPKRIAVIGGGFTGLVAAYELGKRGCQVALFERGDYLGGLASGFAIEDHPLEKAYHHLFTTDSAMLALVHELGLDFELIMCADSKALYHAGRLYPFTTPFDLLHFTPLSFFNRLRFGFVTLYLTHAPNWQRFIPIPAAAWLKKWYGAQAYAIVWEPLLKGKFHNHYTDVSMAWLWARINSRGNSKDQGRERVIYFRHGFAVVVKALTRKLKELGVDIKYQTQITAVTSSTVPTITFTDGTSESFDRIICTTPSHVFARLIETDAHASEEYLAQLNSINYLGAVLIIFSSSQSLSKYFWHNLNDPASPFLVFLQHTNLVDPAWYNGKHIYYLGAYLSHEHAFFRNSDQEVASEGFDYIKKLFPSFKKEAVRQMQVFRFPNAQHIVDTDYTKKIPDYKTPLPGIYLANFSQIFPEDRGTNFAVREGIKIAKLVCADLRPLL